MEIPTPKRSLLKAWTWRLILMILASEVIALTIICSSGRTDAPGVKTPPGQSRIGKVNSPDRGGSVSLTYFFKHNAFYYQAGRDKLNPETDKQNIILFHRRYSNLFNIINIIEQLASKQNLVFGCGDSIHILSTKLSTSVLVWEIPHFGTQRTFNYACEVAKVEQKRLHTRVGDYSVNDITYYGIYS